MKFGFALRRIALTGPGKQVAEVTFTRGLNVIAGPSDTGKSLIAQCINYALGGGDPPKESPELNGYNSVVLEIEGNGDRRNYSLERSLPDPKLASGPHKRAISKGRAGRGKGANASSSGEDGREARGTKILCRTADQPDRILASRHKSGEEDTVSQFLLNLSGLGTKKVRTNERGTTRGLSFRDIAMYVIVDEQTVIKDDSPVLSELKIDRTVEKGVFRLLLTGADDGSVIEMEDPKVAQGRTEGRVELLDGLLLGSRERLSDYGEVATLSEEEDRLSRIETSIEAAFAERDAAQGRLLPLQKRHREIWSALRMAESKHAVLLELLTRFDLLHGQYLSDLRRLSAISEAALRLGQLKEERCPMCGALAEYHDETHLEAGIALGGVSWACKAEAGKTFRLLRDLLTTRSATAAKVEQLQMTRDRHQNELNDISAELKVLIAQHVDVAIRKVDELRTRAENCRRSIELLERIKELESLRENARKSEKGKKRKKGEFPDAAVTTEQAEAFSKKVEALLKEWHFPGADRVSFREKDQDIVISGRARKSHGKGVLAITRASFNLALLRLCMEDERPFPNFVIIDSPLLVYEQPDVDESSFPLDVKRHFWTSLKESFVDAQVIIIENSKQVVGSDTLGDVNVVLFSGNDQGRRGFIPSSTAVV